MFKVSSVLPSMLNSSSLKSLLSNNVSSPQHDTNSLALSSLLAPQVGAINTRLLDVPWLDVRAIDLKSQHPRIQERDFFSLETSGEYDVVCSR